LPRARIYRAGGRGGVGGAARNRRLKNRQMICWTARCRTGDRRRSLVFS
jgi:hypothetical protein